MTHPAMRRLLPILAALAAAVGVVAVTNAAPSSPTGQTIRCDETIGTVDNVCHAVDDTTEVESSTTTNAASTSTAAPTTTSTPPTTETTSAPGSTSTTPSTAAPATTAPSTTSPPVTGGPGCGLPDAAFCETFSTAYPDTVSRTGDLDHEIWGVSRMHNQGNVGVANQWFTPIGYIGQNEDGEIYDRSCGIGFAPNDVKVCNGRLLEAVQDGGNDSKTTLAVYPKQPFNWAGRTGTIVFDLSNDTEGPHTAWGELWVTDKPTPAPGADGHSQPVNGFGINFSGNSGCATAPSQMNLVVDNKITEVWPDIDYSRFRCVATSAANSPALNHIRITVAANKVEMWQTEPGGTTEYLMGTWNVTLPLSQGLVWMQDGHYNGCKDAAGQCDHVFAWDNFGFDGPKTYRDLSFDALDRQGSPSIPTGFGNGFGNPGYNLGWDANTNPTIEVHGVHLGDKTPTAAYVMFNSYTFGGRVVPSVSLNGHTYRTVPWAWGEEGYTVHAVAVPVPLSEINTDGSPNVLRFTSTDNGSIANINIVLVNAQTVP